MDPHAFDIVALDPADTAGIDEWFFLFDESQRVEFPTDPPESRRARTAEVGKPWPGELAEHWVAREDGETVGTAMISLPQLDNTQTAIADVLVGVRHRRRGVGRALFEHVVDRTRAEGRVRVLSFVREPLPESAEVWPGASFVEAMGAKRALDEVRRRLHIEALDHAVLDDLEPSAVAAGPGYRLVQWQNEYPEDILDDLAVLDERMSTDPPLGDVHWEPEVHDRDRLKAVQEALRARGRDFFGTGVVHEQSGTLVGYTQCAVDPDVPQHAWQWATIVLPEHRGHRLGMRLKIANLRWLLARSAGVQTIDTWNAAENAHMVAVNVAMGFRQIELSSEWQLDL